MPLNDLSLDELNEMADTVATLCRVGNDLYASGLTPVFDLSPGKAVIIRLNVVMPAALGQATMEDVARIEAKVDQRIEQTAELVRQIMADSPVAIDDVAPFAESAPILPGVYRAPDGTLWSNLADMPVGEPGKLYAFDNFFPSTEAALSEPALEPVEAPPADEGPAGGDPQSSAVPSSAVNVASLSLEAAGDPPTQPEAATVGAAEDSGGGQQLAAAPSPAAPLRDSLPGLGARIASPSTSHERTFSGAAAWTEAEDTRLVDMLADGIVRLGLSKSAAMRAAATELAHPEQGTAFRCQHKLKARIDAAIEAARSKPATALPDLPHQDESPVAEPQADVVGQSGEAPASVTAAAAGAPSDGLFTDPLTFHLRTLTDKGGWTLDRDLELMELSIAGWARNEIALQIQMQANAIQPRFDALTGLYTDANDKKQRRFSREAVFEALTRLAGKAA